MHVFEHQQALDNIQHKHSQRIQTMIHRGSRVGITITFGGAWMFLKGFAAIDQSEAQIGREGTRHSTNDCIYIKGAVQL